jgi:hypothetical protein
MDLKTRKTYYNRCDPSEPLDPGDDRNVDLDDLGPTPVRGINWVHRLASRIELSDKPVFELFTGLPGSGKSTELRRLAARLEKPDGAHLLPVLVDAERVLDLANPIDVPEIIAGILECTEAVVLRHEGKDPEKAMEEGYLTRLWAWLTRTDVDIGKGELTIPGGPKLVAEMKTRPTLRQRVRATIAAHLTTFLREARDEMKLLESRATGLGYSGLVVIFDSLEKLRGISTNWTQVLESAEQLFAAGAPYLRLPVHILYTVPPALAARRWFDQQVQFIPMIKLRERNGADFKPGLDAARELVRKRVPDAVLIELLGPSAEARIKELILWSGGYPREIIRLLRSAFALSTAPISEEDLQRIISEIRDAYRKIVPADAYEWLAQVSRDHYLVFQSDGHRQAADLMLQNNAVLRYLNGGDWFDLHPAVQQIPGVQEAKQALARPSSGADPVGHTP